MSEASANEALVRAYEVDRREIWALCYRMTGSAADAEDLVQSTFERALERPPQDTGRPWRPWLFRVAINLARDQLRRRKRRVYKGPWLPEPIDTDELVESLAMNASEPRVEPPDTAGRYDLLESVSYAFLVALEALTPTQRAVLILRDVLEQSAAEVAEMLETSEGNVRVHHHRARKKMSGYDADPIQLGEHASRRTKSLAGHLARCMVLRDIEGIADVLADGAISLTDGAGRFAAATVPIEGREKVARFYVGITKGNQGVPFESAWVRVNGLPALLVEYDPKDLKPRRAPRFVVMPRLSRSGAVSAIYLLQVPEKLGALPTVEEARSRFDQSVAD